MVRILHMIGSLNVGGSQTMVMNLYRCIDRSRIQFDFILDHANDDYFVTEIENLGGKVYEMPMFKGINILQVKRAWRKFFEQHSEYKVIHSHVRSYASVYLPIAKKYGLKTIIHSHSTSNGKGIINLIKRIMQYPLRYEADYFFGCSKVAGEWLFGKRVVNSGNYYMIQNAIDLSLYKFDSIIRERYRNEFHLRDKIVFGHIGRFHEAKNHKFLLEVFSEIHKKNPQSILMLVGDGELRGYIEQEIKDLKIEDFVIVMGLRSDVNELLQAMDCFLFPSKWEGLPVTVVEAQAAGLPCFVSDTITRDVGISDLVTYLPIGKGAQLWSSTIIDHNLERKDVSKQISEAGFSIETSVKWLSEFYERIWP